jgi:GT2 family glycosyltransferase
MLRIVIVIYKNQNEIPILVDSLKSCIRVPHEIVFIDNSPGASDIGVEEKFKGNSRYIIKSEKNLGFSKAANLGAWFKGGYYDRISHFLFLNPDTLFLDPLTAQKFAEIEKLQGIVGFAVFNDIHKKSRQASARSFPSFWTAISNREGILTRLFPKNKLSSKYLRSDLELSKPSKVDWVSGCALILSKKDFEKLGGFDEQYFLYIEDVDLCRKAESLSVPVYLYPHIAVMHYSRKSASKTPLRSDFFHHLGMFRYFWKWAGFERWILGPVVALGILARLCVRQIERTVKGL